MSRSLVSVFNEKTLCGLGREVQSTGLLAPDAVARALTSLRRFRALCKVQKVGRVHAIATAACRDATNGPDFIAKAERICGIKIEILSGPREAKLSALGVISGIHKPDGIVGDLGGGSLELIDVRGNGVRSGVTLVLEYVIRVAQPKTIVFSTFGVREGLLYSMLPEAERVMDGFLCGAQTLNELLSRSARHAQELIGWTDRLVRVVGLRESEEDRRLRHAACLLSDIGWRVHPDHRGEQTLSLITNGNFGSISHQGRAFVGLSVFFRYGGLSGDEEPPAVMRDLLSPAQLERARVLGAAFRVAHLISAARPGVLPATHFRSQDRKLMLMFEHKMVDLVADRVGSRFRH